MVRITECLGPFTPRQVSGTSSGDLTPTRPYIRRGLVALPYLPGGFDPPDRVRGVLPSRRI